MSTHQNGTPPAALLNAIKRAWEREQSGAAPLGVSPATSRVAPAASGWTIPVASGVQPGSEYE